MTKSTAAPIDPREKITVNCDEPNCRHYESGHEIYAIQAWDPAIIHERTDFGEVTVSRDPSQALWDIEINTRAEYTVAEAQELIDVLTAAVADANALNAGRA